MTAQTINIAPSWAEAANMLALVCEAGTDEGRAQVADEVRRMGQIIDQLQSELAKHDEPEPAPAPAPAHRPNAAYLSPIPAPYAGRYDTVLGYLARHVPVALEYDAWDPELTQRDGFWLMHRAKERGLDVIKVKAPDVLQAQGIDLVNAYPVALLEERLGD